ncbi:hypothetical protein ACJA28_01890 [Mesomycoplasma moatsii]|uniref:hypothetical protein n=1 Tax=Mesomycoplasma moatsii TaxID=171287 RepID=UPI0003B6D13C
MNLSDALVVTNIVITTLIGFPALYLGTIEIIRRSLIARTWDYMVDFFEKLEMINQWNNNKYKLEKWKDYIDQLIHQGLIWFLSKDIFDEFNDLKSFDLNSFFQIKKSLKNEKFNSIYKMYIKWKLINKKLNYVVDTLFLYRFITLEDREKQLFSYNWWLINNLKIEKTSITFIDSLDVLRLWGSKISTSSYDSEIISLKKIKNNKNNINKIYLNKLKKHQFIFNIVFKTTKEENNLVEDKNLKIFSIHFKKNIIEKIETIYDWDQFYHLKNNKNIDIFISCLLLIKEIFNIDFICKYLSNIWQINPVYPKIYITDPEFENIKKRVNELDKKENL